MAAAVTAVVVSYADPTATGKAIESLLDQSHAPLEIVVVDNDPSGATVRAFSEEGSLGNVRFLYPRRNLGYTGGANLAASEAAGEWLFFLNPDAVADADCLRLLLDTVDASDVAIVGAQILLPDGRINAGDNPVNIAGISWSGGYGHPREHGVARDTAAVSGAALLVRREDFCDVGGMCPLFFLYVDDTDLAWRMRLAGRRVRYCPEAVVVHDYEFQTGARKWFYLERNRAFALLSNLQLRTLALLAPLLLASEFVILARAAREGWLREKLRAWAAVAVRLPALAAWRRRVQATRRVADGRVLERFVAGFETDLLDARLPAWVNVALGCYRRILLALLDSPRR